jgi:hypothetical protein
LAVCADPVRLHPPRHAAECAAVTQQRGRKAVSAYILNLNGLVPAEATLDAKTLAAIKMPNRNDFVPDPRPDVK